MACALPVLVQTEGDGIPDFLLCPICLELPEEKVFQCKEGHSLCGSCYVKYEHCPHCRSRFDKSEPFRNRHFEGMLDKFVKVNCAYKKNGCIEQPTRELVQAHQTKCLFNIDRFGKMVNLCPLIGYKDCDFRFNNGNIEDAVNHFVLAHSCVLTGSNPFQMKLTGFQESTEISLRSTYFWTPVISDLKERKCFLLTCAMLDVSSAAGAFTCFSLIMPKSHDVSETLTMEYSLASDKDPQLELGFFRKSMLLSNVESALPNNLPCSRLLQIQIQNLKSHLEDDGSLLVNCNVRESGTNIHCSTDVKVRKLERIVCSKTTVSNAISSACKQGHDSSSCGSMNSKKEEEIVDKPILTAREIENGIKVDTTEPKMSFPTPGNLQYDKILVENLPDFANKNHVKNVFTQFGEVKSIQMLKQNPNGVYLSCKSKSKTIADACLVDFARQTSVDTFLNSKWRPSLKKNGRRHHLNAKILTFCESASGKYNENKGFLDFWEGMEYSFNNPEAAESLKLDRNDVLGLLERNYPLYTPGCKYFERVCGIMFLIAAEYGTVDCVKFCIEKGMDINAIGMKDEGAMSVLARTLFDKDKEIGLEKSKLLVESGADIHFKDKIGWSLLHMSVIYGSNENVKFFLEKGLNVNAVNKARQTPLLTALVHSTICEFLIEKVNLLLDHGARLNSKDKYGLSPLQCINMAPVKYRVLIEEMFKKHLNA